MKTKETNPTRPESPTPCKQALSVYDLLERQDRKVFRKGSSKLYRTSTLSYEKKLVINLRYILCILNTLSLTIQFLNTDELAL